MDFVSDREEQESFLRETTLSRCRITSEQTINIIALARKKLKSLSRIGRLLCARHHALNSYIRQPLGCKQKKAFLVKESRKEYSGKK